MTESEWLASNDPAAMLDVVRGKVGDRKLRLFACACLMSSNQELLKNTDRYGCFEYGEEGELITPTKIVAVCQDWAISKTDYDPLPSIKADILRDIVGNPWINPIVPKSKAIIGLASEMYESRSFVLMPILHDALMDADCFHQAVLNHCLEPIHNRGCWVVDMILGKQ